MTDEEFFLEYCEVIDLHLVKRVGLIADEDGTCVFFGEGGCEIYDERPRQCRSFPFWATNLVDEAAWRSVTTRCPGANQGTLHTATEIADCLQAEVEDPLLDLDED